MTRLLLALLLVPTAVLAQDREEYLRAKAKEEAKAKWYEARLNELNGPHAADYKLLAETGVQLPAVKFYKYQRVSQQLSIINGEHVHGIYAGEFDTTSIINGKLANTNKKPIWAAPGGLVWSPREQWRNATAVYLPSKPQVWRELTKVTNSSGSTQDNCRLAWAFPEGTVFVDLLIRRHNGEEWPFELRTRTKENGEWNAIAYRTFAEPEELPTGSRMRTFAVSSLDPKIPARDLDAWIVPATSSSGHGGGLIRRSFKPSRLALTTEHDGGFTPKHYIGNVVSCVTCHARAGESEGYDGVAAPGSDHAIGWHPFKLDTLNTDRFPVIDTERAVYIGFRGRNVDHLGRTQR